MFIPILALYSTAVFIATLPLMVLFHVVMIKQCKQEKIRVALPHIIATYVLSFMLITIFSITGIPSITNLTVDVNINLIPFIDISSNFNQYIQNIILFVPLGFLLPMLWHKFEKLFKIFITGLLLSLSIEIMQIFSFRVTDIDDLLMNNIGTVVGYFLFVLIKRLFPIIKIFSIGNNVGWQKWEVYFYFALTWSAIFFIQPFISILIMGGELRELAPH